MKAAAYLLCLSLTFLALAGARSFGIVPENVPANSEIETQNGSELSDDSSVMEYESDGVEDLRGVDMKRLSPKQCVLPLLVLLASGAIAVMAGQRHWSRTTKPTTNA